jgi:hypothetical protein
MADLYWQARVVSPDSRVREHSWDPLERLVQAVASCRVAGLRCHHYPKFSGMIRMSSKKHLYSD